MPMTGSNRVSEVENLAARFPLENRQTGRRCRLVVAERKRKLNDGNRCFLSLASFCSFPRWPRSRPLRRPSGTTSCTAVTAWVHPHPPLWWTGTIWVSSSGTSARTTGRRSASASASGSRSSARRGEWSLSFSALRSSLGCRERLRIHERRWRKRASMERSAKREGRGRKGSCFFLHAVDGVFILRPRPRKNAPPQLATGASSSPARRCSAPPSGSPGSRPRILSGEGAQLGWMRKTQKKNERETTLSHFETEKNSPSRRKKKPTPPLFFLVLSASSSARPSPSTASSSPSSCRRK